MTLTTGPIPMPKKRPDQTNRVMAGKASLSGEKNKAIKRVRALEMVAKRVKGTTIPALAEEYNCSTTTVARTLDWAEKTGLIEAAEDRILNDLVPLAIEAYKQALADGDTMVAKDVLRGMGVLKKDQERPVKVEAGSETTLEAVVLRLRGKNAQPELPVVEAQALPPAPEEEADEDMHEVR